MNINEDPSIPVDVRGTMAERKAWADAEARQKVWQAIGMPESAEFMTEDEMNKLYRGRLSCSMLQVLEECQRALRFVACPACRIEKNYGEITITRFHIRIIDDPMTTFPALARCFCYNCAYEEFWPLQMDPRAQRRDEQHREDAMRYAMEAQRQQAKQAALGAMYGGPLNRGGMAQGIGGLGAMGQNVANMGVGVPGGTPSDQQAAVNLLNRYAKHAPAMSHPERATLMQKIRDAMSGK